jgi:antirestriction protein ArdC
MENNNEKSIDVYALVTNRIIELMEQGTIPWQKPWMSSGPPKNLLSKRPYQGVNVLLLNSLEYTHNLYLTWKQIKTIGGSVLKGEKGHFVVFNKMVEKTVNDKVESTFFLRYYKVFNIDQCKDIPKELIPAENTDIAPIVECNLVYENMKQKPQLVCKENEAYYSPKLDIVNMPKLKTFKSIEEYYGVLYHELIHSTGHESRLHRKEIVDKLAFGTKGYSLEELVAEIGSCFLIAHTGLPMDMYKNSASYIENWLAKLKDDKRFIFKASSRAQKAVEYILNVEVAELVENNPEDEILAEAKDLEAEF